MFTAVQRVYNLLYHSEVVAIVVHFSNIQITAVIVLGQEWIKL